MGDYSIRPATSGDLPELARMRTALRDYLGECDPAIWLISDEKAGRLAEFYGELIKKDTARVYVAETGGIPVGMLVVRILDNPHVKPARFGRIDDAWVDPDHRRRGLMRRLTQACGDFLASGGVERVMLDYAIRNPDSEKCWSNLGFEPCVVIAHAGVAEVTRPNISP
jgi:ribosomal protein S18 acetylase RimI-like enzyme